MKTVVSLTNLNLIERHSKLESATSDSIQRLKEQFPESQGFGYKIQERLAKWAWPRNTQMSEQQILDSTDADTRRRAFRRGIRITKGLTWGITIDFQTTDREMTGVQVTLLRESPLTIILATIGLMLGILATVAYGYQLNVYKDDYRNIVIAMFIGFAVGAVLALIGWVLSKPFESLKPEHAKVIFDSLVEQMATASVATSV